MTLEMWICLIPPPLHRHTPSIIPDLPYNTIQFSMVRHVTNTGMTYRLTPPLPHNNINDFTPFANQAEFEFMEFLFSKVEMSAGKLDDLAHLLAALYQDQDPPYASHEELYSTIDSIPHGDVPWNSITVSYDGEIPEGVEAPSWKSASYEVWY
jgi:hypothetical protein